MFDGCEDDLVWEGFGEGEYGGGDEGEEGRGEEGEGEEGRGDVDVEKEGENAGRGGESSSDHSGSGEKGLGVGDIGLESSIDPVIGEGEMGRNVCEFSRSYPVTGTTTEFRFGGISKLNILAISASGVGDIGLWVWRIGSG